MRRWGTLALVAAMAALLGGLGVRAHVEAPVARAAQTWGVVVGGDPMPGWTDINFYPRTVTINAGDTVSFSFPSGEPHTVTFDAGQVPGLFLTGIRPDSPSRGDLDLTKAFSPLNVTGPIASYDGSQAISSGVPIDPPDQRELFVVAFPRTGTYHFECAVHGPEMAGDVVVLAAGAAVPETPAQAAARGVAEAAADLTNTIAISQALPIAASTTAGPGGATLHTLAVGGMGYHVAALQFLPRQDLTVKRGDYVSWNQPDINEFHTVTFLSGGTPPLFLQIVPQANGSLQIILPAAVNAPSGGNTYTGTGVVNSGSLTTGNVFTLRIDAPPGTYDYVCLFHDGMKGTITVTP